MSQAKIFDFVPAEYQGDREYTALLFILNTHESLKEKILPMFESWMNGHGMGLAEIPKKLKGSSSERFLCNLAFHLFNVIAFKMPSLEGMDNLDKKNTEIAFTAMEIRFK